MVDKTQRLINRMKKANVAPSVPIMGDMHLPNHSGDHSRGIVNTTPTQDTDLVNKKYVDDNAGGAVDSVFGRTGAVVAVDDDYTLDLIDNPAASVAFNFGNNKTLDFSSVDTTVTPGQGVFNFQASGAFDGRLVHIHQHTGNPGADTVLLELEAEDSDVLPLSISGAGTWDIETVAGIHCATEVSSANITTLSGAYDTHAADSSDPHGANLTQTDAVITTVSSANIINTGDHNTSAAAYCVGAIMHTSATPPTASNFPYGTVYYQHAA